jgi:hypothetical protein
LADKSSRLIRDALSRAATEPDGLALLANKSEPGLFPPTSLAKTAALRCKEEGFLQIVRTESKGKVSREICVLTDKGRQYLLHQSDPREVLEDLVRVLESRHAEVEALAESVHGVQRSLEGIRAAVEQVLPQLAPAAQAVNGATQHGVHMNGNAAVHSPPSALTASDDLIAEVKEKLAAWHTATSASEDCPLPELYRRLESDLPTSIGQFHDCLRRLHEERMIYLHPWTGPLYALPEPAFALLVGHEIGYYASIR